MSPVQLVPRSRDTRGEGDEKEIFDQASNSRYKKAMLATPARKANIKSGIQQTVHPTVNPTVAPTRR